jgi:hypothetical protein
MSFADIRLNYFCDQNNLSCSYFQHIAFFNCKPLYNYNWMGELNDFSDIVAIMCSQKQHNVRWTPLPPPKRNGWDPTYSFNPALFVSMFKPGLGNPTFVWWSFCVQWIQGLRLLLEFLIFFYHRLRFIISWPF